MRVVNQQVPTAVPRRRRRDSCCGPTCSSSRAGAVSCRSARSASRARSPRQLGQVSAMDVVARARRGAAVGRSTRARASSATCATVLSDPDRTDDFRVLENELYLAATDLDTCERIVFGADGLGRRADLDRRPRLHRAADGLQAGRGQGPRAGRRRHRLDDQRRHRGRGGREVRRRRQPARPVRQRLQEEDPDARSARARAACSDMGFPQIGYQSFKLLAYQRLHEIARQWEERYPGVDIVLIEPEPDDELMFQTSIMNFTSRVDIARHGFESVTLQARQGLRHFRDDLRAPRHRDLGHARAQGRQALRRREGAHARLAQDPRADDGRAAAPVGVGRRGRGRRARGPQRLRARAQRSQEAVRRGCWIATRTCSLRRRAAAPGATITPPRRSASASSTPVHPRCAQPQDVGLAGGRVDRQRRAARRAAGGARPRPARGATLDLRRAGVQRLQRAGLRRARRGRAAGRAAPSSGSRPRPPTA